MKFVLASNNEGKLREMREILSELDIELISQNEAGCVLSVEETGTTFEENAYLKAIMSTAMLGLPSISDDSGLCVEALGGEPGVYSARYGSPEVTTDEGRVELLLKNLDGQQDRRAKFVSSICCTFPNGDKIVANGECPGVITESPRGDGGFGYDPVFLPDGCDKTMAEMSAEEKNAISHRKKALDEFKKGLVEYYAADQ
jgi:XTP/dITP diphosphohydrolase